MNATHVKELDETKMKLIEETGKLHEIGVMVIDRMKAMDYDIPFMARKCGMMEGAESNYVSHALDELESNRITVEEHLEEIKEQETKHEKVVGHIGRLLTEDQKGQLLGEAVMDPEEQCWDIHDYLDKIAQFLRGKVVEQ